MNTQTRASRRHLPIDKKFIVVGEEGRKPKTICVDREPSALPRWKKRQLKRERKA